MTRLLTNTMRDKVWGYRGRVGLIMPAPQTVTEPLFYATAPEGISFHTSRLLASRFGPTGMAESEALVPKAIDELVQARVNCIAYLCVTGGLVRGVAGEKQFCQEMAERAGVPVISALLSALEALNLLKIRRIIITGPYPDEHNVLERRLFQDNGFEVRGIYGLGITNGLAFGQVPPRDIYEFCLKCWDTSADGMFIACCAFNAMLIAPHLERRLGVPVVTAHSAVLWKVLRTLGITEPLPNLGKLLGEYL